MKLKKGIQILTVAILFLGIAAYFVYAIFWAAEQKDADDVCKAVDLEIKENLHSGFINRDIIETALRTANIYPEGRLMSEISTSRIEEVIAENDFVESVNCYKTANQKVHIDITQRTPVIYILRQSGQGYYVDRRGKLIPKTTYPVNMPVATGQITQQYATQQLSRLAGYIVADDFWNSLIEQIDVQPNEEGENIITLVPRIGQQTIVMGTIDNYEAKLSRLRTFYEQAMTTVGWNKYTTIDLEYDGQIICKKQKDK